MSRVCTLYGVITDPTPVLDRIVGDESLGDTPEQFYKVMCSFYRVEIPLLISEHNLSKLTAGPVKVTGALMSDYQPQTIFPFYIYTSDIEKVEPDTSVTNTVDFRGTITKIRTLRQDSAGRDVLGWTLNDQSPLETASVLFVSLKGQLARQYQNVGKYAKVIGTGYLAHFRDVYEINVTNVQIL